MRAALGYKLKPDNYDGSVPLREFFFQFNLIARANQWDDAAKTVALASSLRGKARAVLESVEDLEELDFAGLKLKLELRFWGKAFVPGFLPSIHKLKAEIRKESSRSGCRH